MLGLLRLVHPAPAVTVVVLSAALGGILAQQAGEPFASTRLLLTVVAVAGSQILTGALNDWADRDRDRVAQPTKPIPSGQATPRAALLLAAFGGLLLIGASLPLGLVPLLLGVTASVSAAAYNLWLSRTPLSVLPYLVSFGLLPLWVAAGVGAPLERVAAAPVLVGPFAAAAHLANALRDYSSDARLGSNDLAHTVGRSMAFAGAWGMAMAVGVGVGAALLLGGRPPLTAVVLGAVGLAAVAQGVAGPQRLWSGILVAAVSWTAAWALATG